MSAWKMRDTSVWVPTEPGTPGATTGRTVVAPAIPPPTGDTPQPAGWGGQSLSLSWADEFEGYELDTSKWTINHGTDGGTERKKDDAWATESAVSVNNSVCTIKAEKNSLAVDNNVLTTMAFLTTRGLFDTFTHGWLEARMKSPRGKSLWPAFWSLGNGTGANGWPQCGEFDWIEWFNSHNISGVHTANMHWGRNRDTVYGPEGTLKYEHQRHDANAPNSYGKTWSVVPYWDDQFHTWGVHRTSNFMRVYVDGAFVYEWLLGETPTGKYKSGQVVEYEPMPASHFDDPIHHRFDLQVGGHSRYKVPEGTAGAVQMSDGDWVLIDEGALEIDYLRAWEMDA